MVSSGRKRVNFFMSFPFLLRQDSNSQFPEKRDILKLFNNKVDVHVPKEVRMEIPFHFLLVEAAVAADSDVREGKVHNSWLLFCLLWNIGWLLWNRNFLMLARGILGGLLPMVLFPMFQKKWLGAGDIKLLSVLGLSLGYQIVSCILFSFLAGGILGLIAIVPKIHRGTHSGKETIPFAAGIFLGLMFLWLQSFQ